MNPNPERVLRHALVDLIAARRALGHVVNDAQRRTATTRLDWCRRRVLALNPPADLVRSLTTGNRDGILVERRTAVPTDVESRARADVHIGCADVAVRGTPGTHVVHCINPAHRRGHVRHV